jgi:hypothetical protein
MKVPHVSLILVHDESTFKSGEVSAKRRFFGDEAPFHFKGRGRSNMVSDFIVQHESGPFFSLSPHEYQKVVVKHPQLEGELLLFQDSAITYFSFDSGHGDHLRRPKCHCIN